MATIEEICESESTTFPEIFDSEVFTTCWSRVQATSSLAISDGIRSMRGWKALMGILQRADVSQVRHLMLPPNLNELSCDIDDLIGVLGTGRFSALETLSMESTMRHEAGSMVHDIEHLAIALRTGQFHNLRSLSLPPCSNIVPILNAVCDGAFFELRKFCLRLTQDAEIEDYPSSSRTSLDADDQTKIPGILQKIFESGRFKKLQNLELTNGALGGVDGFRVLVSAIKSEQVPDLRFLQLGYNNCTGPNTNLSDLVQGGWFSSLELLGMERCYDLSSKQLSLLVGKIISAGDVLALRRLELGRNPLDSKGIEAIVQLANGAFLPRLEVMDLSSMPFQSSIASLLGTIETGRLPRLQKFDWRGNSIDNDVANDIVRTYVINTTMTVNILIDWQYVDDNSLKAKALEFRERNLRLRKISEQLVTVRVPPYYFTLDVPSEDEPYRIKIDDHDVTSVPGAGEREPCYVDLDVPSEDELCGDLDVPNEDEPDFVIEFDDLQASYMIPAVKCGRIELDDVLDNRIPYGSIELDDYDMQNGPVRTAKVFLCGYPGVGKSTLRKSLQRATSRIGSKFRNIWHRKKTPTRGIELFEIQRQKSDDDGLRLVLWDLAGREEFHVMHSSFLLDLRLAAGKATTFVLVFKSRLGSAPGAEKELLYWLRFVAASSLKELKRQVIIVLNCFDGIRCPDHELIWKGLINKLAPTFQELLCINLVPFVVDCSAIRSVKELEDRLFSHAKTQLEDVRVPRACLTLQEELRMWLRSATKVKSPILSWEAFEGVPKFAKYLRVLGRINLKSMASYLHELGEIIYFNEETLKEPGLESRSIIVLDPAWFYSLIVGQLFLPKEILQGGQMSVKDAVARDGSISIIQFREFFVDLLADSTQVEDFISMLVRLGLCYRMGTTKLVVPALITQDDLSSVKWDSCGEDWVMGRCLVPKDLARVPIPMALFRRLQVELAQDERFGGREDSGYCIGKSYCTFNAGGLLVLVQFDVDPSDPADDRVDILVKCLIRGEDRDLMRWEQIACICAIMEKLENLCVQCCPGLTYEKKVIKPWSASGKSCPMPERRMMSLTEIKKRIVQRPGLGAKYTSWEVGGTQIRWETLLSLMELEEIKSKDTRDYDALKRDAVGFGLLSPKHLKEIINEEKSASKPARPSIVSDDDNRMITNWELLNSIRAAIREDGDHTRQKIDWMKKELLDGFADIREKQDDLVRRLQSLQSFSIEEAERSLPRYMFLSKREGGKSSVWITVKEAFQTVFQMHLLCEARFEDGLIHEVRDQDGIDIKETKEWLVKISPWLRWSLHVAIFGAKTAANVVLPGLGALIPSVLLMEGAILATAVNDVAAVLSEQLGDSQSTLDPEANRGSGEMPINLKERMIAEAVVGDLIRKMGHIAFAQKIGLRKVVRNMNFRPTGSSGQDQASVVWICNDCCIKYGPRVTDITPRA